jgi:hypothetical protein
VRIAVTLFCAAGACWTAATWIEHGLTRALVVAGVLFAMLCAGRAAWYEKGGGE